jgi:hypothetical protein
MGGWYWGSGFRAFIFLRTVSFGRALHDLLQDLYNAMSLEDFISTDWRIDQDFRLYMNKPQCCDRRPCRHSLLP